MQKIDINGEILENAKMREKMKNGYFQGLDWKNEVRPGLGRKRCSRVPDIGTVVAVVAVAGVAPAKTCCEGEMLRRYAW